MDGFGLSSAPFASNPAFTNSYGSPIQYTGVTTPQTGIMMADLVLQQLSTAAGQSWIPQSGMLPMAGRGNVYNRLDRVQYGRVYNQFMDTSQAEAYSGRAATQLMEVGGGFMRALGNEWNPANTRELSNTLNPVLSGVLGNIASTSAGRQMLDQMPGAGFLESFKGGMFEGMSRYQLDPTTGQVGYRAADGGAGYATRLFNELYSDPLSSSFRGLKAGQAGELYTELARRGRLPGIGESGGMDQLAAAPDMAEANQLANLPEVKTKLRASDINRVKSTLQDYSEAVQAIQEIFQEEGRQGSVPELLQALDTMTAGATRNFGAQEAEARVRQTYNMARESGVNLNYLNMMNAGAAQLLDAEGLPQGMRGSLVDQALATRSAYMFGNMGSRTAWGTPSIDEAVTDSLRVTAGALNSPTALRLGTALLIQQSREARGGSIDPNSKMGAYLAAAKKGEARFRDPNTGSWHDVAMGSRDFSEMVASSTGMHQGEVMEMLQDTDSAMGALERAGGASLITGLRVAEERGILQQQIESNFNRRLATRLGIEGRGSARRVQPVSQALTGAAMAVYADSSLYGDDTTRQRETFNRFKSTLQQMAAGGGAGAAEAQKLLAQGDDAIGSLADQAWSQVGQVAADSLDPTNSQGLLNRLDPARLERERLARGRSESMGILQEQFAGFGKDSSLIGRFMLGLSQQPDGGDLSKLLATTFGGEDSEKIKAALQTEEGQKFLERVKASTEKYNDEVKKRQEAMKAGGDGEAGKSDVEAAAKGARDTAQDLMKWLGEAAPDTDLGRRAKAAQAFMDKAKRGEINADNAEEELGSFFEQTFQEPKAEAGGGAGAAGEVAAANIAPSQIVLNIASLELNGEVIAKGVEGKANNDADTSRDGVA